MLAPSEVKKTLIGNISYLGGSKIKGVVFDTDGPCFITSDGTVHLPVMSGVMGEEEYVLYLYKVYHEMGHAIAPYDRWGDILKNNNPNEKLKWIYNLTDDHGQERNILGHFKGVDQALREGRRLFLLGNIPERVVKEDEIKLGAVWNIDKEVRENWNPLLKAVTWEIQEDMITWMDKIRDKYMEILSCKSTEETYELSKEIYALLFPDDNPDDMENPPEEGEGEGGDEESEVVDDGKGDPAPSPHDIKVRNTKFGKEYYPNEMTILDIPKRKILQGSEGVMEYFGTGNVARRQAVIENMLESSSHLAGEVRRLMLSRSQIRKIGGQPTGKLQGKSLWKYKQSSRVFSRKEESISLDTAVSVLVDYSGSMNGYDKGAVAAAAATQLATTLNTLGVNTEVAVFTENDHYYKGTVHGIVQGFNRKESKDSMVDSFANAYSIMAQNADGESVGEAAYRLMQQKNKRKVLIVMSDGFPMADNPGDCFHHLWFILEKIKQTPVEVYAIGILSDSVKAFYDEWVTLDHTSQLAPCLLDLIKTKIVK